MINRTGLYKLEQDVNCRTSDSRWTVSKGTQIEVTNIKPEKGVFYSYALGGWKSTDIKAILVIPYQNDKINIREAGDGSSYFLSQADCREISAGVYKGKAIDRLVQYERLFSMAPIELHMLLEKMKSQLEVLRTEKKQFMDSRRYGYNPFPGAKEIKKLKADYPVGSRIVIHHVNDPYIYIPEETMATVHGVDNGGMVHVSCDDGTFIKLVPKADQFEKTEQDGIVPADRTLKVRMKNGSLCASATQDKEYPGIDIEYIPDVCSENILSNPRVLIEWPNGDTLRALIWNDSASEDYIQKIELISRERSQNEQ